MASALPPGRGQPCASCSKPGAQKPLRYLDTQPLCLHEFPPHSDTANGHAGPGCPFPTFFQAVFKEGDQVKFDDDVWVPEGKFPSGKNISVVMPSPANMLSDISVPCHVEKRANGTTKWLARTSNHSSLHIKYSEMNALLAVDHCRKEAEYTPSVFDVVELLRWPKDELRRALAQLNPNYRITDIEMAMYQMCHEMPKACGVPLLQPRVFHVLCITAFSTYHVPRGDSPRLQSHTFQLPVNIESFRSCRTVMARSRYQPSTKLYDASDYLTTQGGDRQRRQKYHGKKMTEGIYASLERLRQGTSCPLSGAIRWDMMTKSDARGIASMAPWSVQKKETLDAISKDVLYVLEHIGQQRKKARDNVAVRP